MLMKLRNYLGSAWPVFSHISPIAIFVCVMLGHDE